MFESLRALGRECLHPAIRKPLGFAVGKLDETVIRPIQGFIFDITGGHFNIDGCSLVVPKNLTSVGYRSCFLRGDYEAEERELIRTHLRPEDSVLEMGACIGIVSCVTNKLLKDRKRHVVVEGNPLLISAIHRNRELNGCEFLVEQCAVSDQPEVTFFLHPEYIVSGTSQRETDRPVRVLGRSWRELLARYRLIIVELHAFAIGEEGVEQCRTLLKEAGLEFVQRAGITEAWVRPRI